jgi:hypothetical protein
VARLCTATDRNAVENLLKKFFVTPQNLSTVEKNEKLAKVEDELWTKWHDFNSRSGKFDSGKRMWLSQDITTNKSYRWHQKYGKTESNWLGKLGCRVTSKINGIGNAERNWGKVKFLKSGQRAHMSADMISKQATIFGSASSERARNSAKSEERFLKWEEDDLDSLGLTKYGVDEKTLESLLDASAPRVYQCWTEEWEEACIRPKERDAEKEARLLQKYGALQFMDGETKFTIHAKKMSWTKERGNKRYCAMGCKPLYEETGENNDEYETFDIDNDLHGLIYEYYSKNPDPKLRVLIPDGAGEDGVWNKWIPVRGGGRGGKKAGAKKT